MACKGRLAEFILHIANFIYFLSGIGILVVGALALDDPNTLVNAMSYVPQIEELSQVMDISAVALGPAIYLTCFGSLVLLLSIVGVGGAFKRSKPIIMIFGLLTLLMMLFNIAIVMFYAIDPYFIQDTVQTNMQSVHEEYFHPVSFAPNGTVILPDEEHAAAWVRMQFEQGCCGVKNGKDYQSEGYTWNNSIILPGGNAVDAKVPPSCCLLKIPNTLPTTISDFADLNTCLQVDFSTTNSEYAYKKGCTEYVMQQATRYNFVYAVVAAGMSGLQAIILCLTLWLFVLDSGNKV